MRNEIKNLGHEFNSKLHSFGFWALFLILIGITIGFVSAAKYFNNQVDESIMLKRFLKDGIIYEITPCPISNNLTATPINNIPKK